MNFATRLMIVVSMVSLSNAVFAEPPDPTKTDGDKYRVVFENDRIRVLRYHDMPGAKTKQHHHPDSLLYALSSFKRRLTFADGKVKNIELKEGDTLWLGEQMHTGENIGSTNTEVLLVEMKAPTPAKAPPK